MRTGARGRGSHGRASGASASSSSSWSCCFLAMASLPDELGAKRDRSPPGRAPDDGALDVGLWQDQQGGNPPRRRRRRCGLRRASHRGRQILGLRRDHGGRTGHPASIIVIAIGVIDQHDVNAQSVLGAISIYVLLGVVFVFVYGTAAVLNSGPFFAQEPAARSRSGSTSATSRSRRSATATTPLRAFQPCCLGGRGDDGPALPCDGHRAAGRPACAAQSACLGPAARTWCSSSCPSWTTPQLDSGTSFQAPSRSPRGSETMRRVSAGEPVQDRVVRDIEHGASRPRC